MISYLRHLFVPHHSNNHRPKLLHHKSLMILILLILIVGTWTHIIRQTAPSVLGVATNINVNDLLSATNQKRQEEGFVPLVVNDQLAKAANAKAANMFDKDYWAHNAPDGTTPWVFIQHVGYRYIYAGENLAKDFNDSEGVVAAWMASPSHRENMLSQKYTEVGFAVVNGRLGGEETTLVVQMFGRRQSGEIASLVGQQATATGAARTPAVVAANPNLVVVSVTPVSTETPLRTYPSKVGQPAFIAGVRSQPLVNSEAFTKRLSIIVLSMLILAFILDMIYIERRQLIRLVGHNGDHILFLTGAILLVALFGRGVIL